MSVMAKGMGPTCKKSAYFVLETYTQSVCRLKGLCCNACWYQFDVCLFSNGAKCEIYVERSIS